MHTPPALYFFPQAPDLTGIQHAPMPHIHHSPPAHHRHHTHLTGIQRSADATHPPVRPQGNSALAAIQRSADGPPPPVRPLNPHTTKKIPHSKHPLQRTGRTQISPFITTLVLSLFLSNVQAGLSTIPEFLCSASFLFLSNTQDGLPEGRLHGRDPVRRSKPLVILSA